MLGEIYLTGVVVTLPLIGYLAAKHEDMPGVVGWLVVTVMSAVMWPLMVGFVMLSGVGEVSDDAPGIHPQGGERAQQPRVVLAAVPRDGRTDLHTTGGVVMDDKTKRAKPLPCPFCGKKRVTVERYCVGSHKEYWVECLSRKCGEATGPLGDTADEAVAKWNAAPRPQEVADA